MANELPKRSEVKLEDTWKLSDMFESDDAWEQELSQIKDKSKELVSMEGKVGECAKSLIQGMDLSA